MAMRSQFDDFVVKFSKKGKAKVLKEKKKKGKQKNMRVHKDECAEIGCMAEKYGRVGSTRATEFIVVEDIGCSPSANWAIDELTGGTDIFVNIRINTTDYFVSPNGHKSMGIRGLASPYPERNIRKRFALRPAIFVLPGQNWEITLYVGKMKFAKENKDRKIMAFVNYNLYDGTDCVVANRLLEMGTSVTPENVDWYRRQLMEGGGLGPERTERAQENAPRETGWTPEPESNNTM